MKGKKFLTGILGVMLVFGLTLFVGCPADDGGDSGPAKYTVTFDPNGGTITGSATQEVEEGKTAVVPAVTAPAGKEANGWASSVPAIPSPYSPITANVVFTAQWKDSAPAGPAPAAGLSIELTNYAQGEYAGEAISKITIYNLDKTVYKEYFPNLKLNDTWTEGKITKVGIFGLTVTIGGSDYETGPYPIIIGSEDELTGTLRLQYDGYDIKKR
jgi:hypothetical protein